MLTIFGNKKVLLKTFSALTKHHQDILQHFVVVWGCSHIMSAKNGGFQTPPLSAKNQKLAYHTSSPCQKKSEIY